METNDYALTEEQRVLAAENHNLIYKFAKIKEVDIDEFYGVFAIGLCMAAKIFDASRGNKFSTLAYKCMGTEYSKYWRHELNSQHIPTDMIVSYNMPITSESGDTQLLDLIIDNQSSTSDTGRIEVDEFFETLSATQRIVLNGLMQGYKETELAEYIGCTRSNINRIKKTIRTEWLRYSIKR